MMVRCSGGATILLSHTNVETPMRYVMHRHTRNRIIPRFISFDVLLACDGQTDRQTDTSPIAACLVERECATKTEHVCYRPMC